MTIWLYTAQYIYLWSGAADTRAADDWTSKGKNDCDSTGDHNGYDTAHDNCDVIAVGHCEPKKSRLKEKEGEDVILKYHAHSNIKLIL